jgi:hypothetical protein
MSLDAFVRCTCIREGKAKPLRLPDRLTFDESGEPTLTADPTEEEWEAHDQWTTESCEQEGYLLPMVLGNPTRVGNLRSPLRGLQGGPGPKFPALLGTVLCAGVHTGDRISGQDAARRLNEVDVVLHSSDILTDSEKEFFTHRKLLSEASVATGNPIMFRCFRSVLNRVNPRQGSLRQS